MADSLIQLFCSKEYHFLSWLKSQEQKMWDGKIINLSQEELALEYGSSPATVNKWLKSLCIAKCIEQKKKGSYRITKKGNKIIDHIGKIEKFYGGNENGH